LEVIADLIRIMDSMDLDLDVEDNLDQKMNNRNNVDKDFVDMDKDLEEDNGLEIIMADIK
jgi:hypothetical protein